MYTYIGNDKVIPREYQDAYQLICKCSIIKYLNLMSGCEQLLQRS